MIKKIIILFSIILITIILFVCINLKETSNNAILEISSTNTENNIFSNILENTAIVTDVTNDIIENVIVESNVKPTKDNTTSKNTISVTPPSSTTTTITTNITSTTTEDKNETTKVDTKVNTEEPTKNESVTNTEQNNTSTDTSLGKEDTTTSVGNPELAYSTYRVTNTEIVPEIIDILNNEISKADDLVAFGCKAFVGNKSTAYSKTSGFTYLFVDDIKKGKIPGNYVTFEQRVRNNIGAFGNYNVYAEDEYTYDGRGLNPKWCQTLVWIYITF